LINEWSKLHFSLQHVLSSETTERGKEPHMQQQLGRSLEMPAERFCEIVRGFDEDGVE
jgi:hypothetical protein